ncbi:hypothetical protein [Methanolobus sp.]|uniref:hypothetical protein n=1 Tax=Methanolobus sp. TaxID=1874737 RepID=UPI0025D5FA6B|nr:hypothetical protein [Methanolobus sp.]
MKNQWIQHLEKALPEKREHGTSFVKMLHVLARDGGKGKENHLHRKNSSQRSRGKFPEKKEHYTTVCTEDHPKSVTVTSTVPAHGSTSSVDTPLREDDAQVELCRWIAESQLGPENGIAATGEDFVQLLSSVNGQLFLSYNVTGEDVFEIVVGSVEEAEKVISDDNMTTAMLYPGNPEYQWSKK